MLHVVNTDFQNYKLVFLHLPLPNLHQKVGTFQSSFFTRNSCRKFYSAFISLNISAVEEVSILNSEMNPFFTFFLTNQ